MIFKKISSVILFLIVFVLPLLVQYASTGVYFLGNDLVENQAYIQNLYELLSYFVTNLTDYLFFFIKPIFFIFFYSLSSANSNKLVVVSWLNITWLSALLYGWSLVYSTLYLLDHQPKYWSIKLLDLRLKLTFIQYFILSHSA